MEQWSVAAKVPLIAHCRSAWQSAETCRGAGPGDGSSRRASSLRTEDPGIRGEIGPPSPAPGCGTDPKRILFQLPHLPAERRLGYAQNPGRPGEIESLGHSDKVAQVSQFHSPRAYPDAATG